MLSSSHFAAGRRRLSNDSARASTSDLTEAHKHRSRDRHKPTNSLIAYHQHRRASSDCCLHQTNNTDSPSTSRSVSPRPIPPNVLDLFLPRHSLSSSPSTSPTASTRRCLTPTNLSSRSPHYIKSPKRAAGSGGVRSSSSRASIPEIYISDDYHHSTISDDYHHSTSSSSSSPQSIENYLHILDYSR